MAKGLKTRWPWLLVAAVLAVVAVSLVPRSTRAPELSVRLVGRTTNATGQWRVVYEVTNGTSKMMSVSLSDLEARHERTGWWDVPGPWPTSWRVEPSAGMAQDSRWVTLHARSTARLEIVSSGFPAPGGRGLEGTALSGKLWYLMVDSRGVQKARSFARRLHLPSWWLMEPKADIIDLPVAELPSAAPLMAATPPTAPGSRDTPAPVTPSAAGPSLLPAGSIKFRSAPLRNVLDIYADLAESRLEIDPEVRALNATVTLESTQALTRAGALSFLERAFREQAGVKLDRGESNSVRVRLEGVGR